MSELMVGTEYVGLQSKVLARVKENPGESPRALASYLEADYNSVTRALSRLVAADLVVNVGGLYSPVYQNLQELIVDTFGPPAAPTPPTRRVRPTWLGLPAALYFIAGIVGYGLGRWFT